MGVGWAWCAESTDITGFLDSAGEGKGSHIICVRDGVREILNFQNVKGKAKPYQVKQLLNVVEIYKLLEE